MTIEYWFVFPVAVLVATTAMASGIGGATFFSPFFILVLGLPPEVAIGTGLMTEVFGFASGVTAYVRRRLIDYKLAGGLLVGAVPLAILGAWLAPRIPADILKTILGMGLLGLAMVFLRSPHPSDVKAMDRAIEESAGGDGHTCLTSASGTRYCYRMHEPWIGRLLAGIGGLFEGMISTGLGEMNGYFLLERCKVPSPVAVATSVFVVAGAAVAAAGSHLIRFLGAEPETLNTVLSIVMFTIPGVIIGGQLGAIVASRLPQRALERGLAVLFLFIATLTLGEAILR